MYILYAHLTSLNEKIAAAPHIKTTRRNETFLYDLYDVKIKKGY